MLGVTLAYQVSACSSATLLCIHDYKNLLKISINLVVTTLNVFSLFLPACGVFFHLVLLDNSQLMLGHGTLDSPRFSLVCVFLKNI